MKANEIEGIVWRNQEMRNIYYRVLRKLYYANCQDCRCSHNEDRLFVVFAPNGEKDYLAEVLNQTISNRFDELETDGMVLNADIDEYQYNSTEEAAYYFARSVYANGGTSDDIVLDY